MDAALPTAAAMKLTASHATNPRICLFLGRVTIHSLCCLTLRVTGRRSAQRGGNPPASEAPLVGGPVHAVVGRQPPKLTRGYAHKRYTGPRWFAATRPRRRAPHSVEAKRYRPNVWRTGSALGESTRNRQVHPPLVT